MNEKMYMIMITIYISNDIAKSDSMRVKRFAMKEIIALVFLLYL